MDSTIKNVKVNELVNLGNVTVTYAKLNENGKFGEEVRLLLKSKDGQTYGVNTSAKQILKTFKENDLKNAIVRFKAYETPNGFISIKCFVQALPKEE